jgi:hypothetical protein
MRRERERGIPGARARGRFNLGTGELLPRDVVGDWMREVTERSPA